MKPLLEIRYLQSYDHLTTFLPHIARTSHKKTQRVPPFVIQVLECRISLIIAWRPAFFIYFFLGSRCRMTACLGILLLSSLNGAFVLFSIAVSMSTTHCMRINGDELRRFTIWTWEKIVCAISLHILYFIVYYVSSAS